MSDMPVRYRADLETPLEGEDDYDRRLTETMLSMSETVASDTGHVRRSVHAKSHGVLHGHLEMLPGTPAEYAQGMFAAPGRFAAILRLSTTPGDMLDDKVSTPRGMALKVIGVEGERLAGSEDDVTQNFVFGNSPAFNAKDSGSFLKNVSKLGATTDVAPGLKKAVSAASRGAEQLLEAFGGQSTVLTTYAGQAMTHILGDSFYSQAPLRHGDYVAKLCISPVSPGLLALKNAPVDLAGRPDGLREEVRAFFAANDAVWEMRVQLCVDLDAMPIEDASAQWPEDRSPYVAVARITVPAQDSWEGDAVARVDDGMTFSPWRGLLAHQPLGSVMRARRRAYESSAAFRRERSGRSMAEPRV
jgi:hypothetical protein